MRFDLSTPNEFKTNTFVQSIVTHAEMHGFALSDDGTKLITIRFTDSTPLVTTYQLPNPYDISSITQIHQVDITDIGVTLPTGGGNNLGRDIEFSKSGHAMFVLIQNTKGNANDTDDTDTRRGPPCTANFSFGTTQSYHSMQAHCRDHVQIDSRLQKASMEASIFILGDLENVCFLAFRRC